MWLCSIFGYLSDWIYHDVTGFNKPLVLLQIFNRHARGNGIH
jgi:hypothetical protein